MFMVHKQSGVARHSSEQERVFMVDKSFGVRDTAVRRYECSWLISRLEMIMVDESFENTNDSNFCCFIWLTETTKREEMSWYKMNFILGKKVSIYIKRNLIHLIQPFLDLVTFIYHFISCFCSKNGNTCKSSSNIRYHCQDFLSLNHSCNYTRIRYTHSQ